MIQIKLCGAVLLLSGGLFGGLLFRRELQKRADTLLALADALARIGSELALRLTPLPDLAHTEASAPAGPVQAFFEQICRLYADTACFSDAWNTSLSLLPLPPDILQSMKALGDTLGRYDADCQREALQYTRERLCAAAQSAEKDAQVRGALAIRLMPGMAAALAILLW